MIFVRPGLGPAYLSRWRTLPSLIKLVAASVACGMSGRQSTLELKELVGSSRSETTATLGSSVAYLKTDLGFGVKAGGSVGHVAGIINGFARKGFHVEVLAPTRLEMLDPSVVSRTLGSPSAFGLPFEFNYCRFQRMFVRQAVSILKARPPAFLYQRMSVSNYAGAALSREMKVPLVAEYNGSETWIAKHWRQPLRYQDLAAMAEDAMLQHAHLVVTVSDVLRDQLVERGVEPDRIVTYPNCIDPEIFDPGLFTAEDRVAIRSLLALDEDDVVVAFVGTFGKWHGATVLARAIQHMVDVDPGWLARYRVRFLFVGDGLEMPPVREILSSEPAGEFVRFAGLVPQVDTPRYLAASDILVSPHVPNPDGSRFFGSPTKLFEYMAMAKGIVASDLEQIGQVLRNSLRVSDLPHVGAPLGDKLAVLVRPDDEKELITGIRFLVEHPDWRRHLGVNARREVLARYTWDHHVSAILEGLRPLEKEA
ncbi:MAG: glycosyltransferase family 4 protein [Nitrospiraceae bacterium]